MSGPPPPPKRKNHKPVATYGTGSGIPVPVGSGINLARAISENNQYQSSQTSKHQQQQQQQLQHPETNNQWESKPAPQKKEKGPAPRKPKNRICVLEDQPDAVIGAGVEIHGDFEYDRLVRIDGKFQGTLFSHNRGDILVGEHGCIIGDVIVARKMIVEGGHVVGKVVVDELLLRGHTIIKGDVTCKLIEIEGPHVTITGRANIHALAPELVDEYDNIITEIPKKPKKVRKEIYAAPKSPTKAQQPPPVAELDLPELEEPELHHHSHKQANAETSSSPAVTAKATSSQTNASARPSRNNKKNDVDPEEAAALEAALAERNAAKERHKQLKQAKNGESAETSEPPKILAPSKPTAPATGNPSTKALIAQKTAADMVAGAIESVVTPRAKSPVTAPKPAVAAPVITAPSAVPTESSVDSPAKSPAKLLPPSEAQRQQQLEEDKKAAKQAKSAAKKAAKAVTETGESGVPEIVPADVEREKAAVSVQRVARGRLARTRTQSNEMTKKEGGLRGTKSAKAESSENTVVNEEDSEAERRRKAAIEVQKIARGKMTRKNAKNRSGKNSPRVDAEPAPMETDGPAADSVEVPTEAESAPPPLATSASAAKVSIEATPSPFGPGYTESLAMES